MVLTAFDRLVIVFMDVRMDVSALSVDHLGELRHSLIH
jgi:hypothetical protein